METIIEEQEKEFKVLQEAKEWFYNWHKERVRQILLALVEREEVELNIIFKNDNGTKYEEGYKDKIKDTIQYLQEQIKKL